MTIGMWAVVATVFLCGASLAAFLIYCGIDDRTTGLIVGGIIALLVTFLICFGIGWWANNSESGKRALKEQESDLQGGLDRTVTLYDYNGNVIDSWSGKFDVSSSETETYFDIDGKRVIIHGGIVVNEEN